MMMGESISELKYWMWFTMAFGPANPRKWNALPYYGTAKQAYEKISGGDLSHVSEQDLKGVKAATMEKAEKMIEYCNSHNINMYSYDDPDYPERLRQIYNPPSLLFASGSLKGLNDAVVIAAVGTRRPSRYTVEVTERICRDLAQAGVVIASGIAVGLDSVCLRSAMHARGKVISVLPCGLNCNYPKENADAKKVIARMGAVLSEYFPEDRPSSAYFRARNRVLSGIALGAFITQAGIGSGALSTASFAAAQGKDIFCIPPHELFNDEYAGVVGLLRDGATPVFDARDILNQYYGVYAHKLNPDADIFKIKGDRDLFSRTEQDNSESGKQPAPPPKQKAPAKKHEQPQTEESSDRDSSDRDSSDRDNSDRDNSDRDNSGRVFISNVIDSDDIKVPSEHPIVYALSDDKKKILDFISQNGTVLFDEIVEAASDIDDVETVLTELELDGFIHTLSGNRYEMNKF